MRIGAEKLREAAGRLDGGNHGAPALLGRLLRDPLPAPRPVAPAGRIEPHDRPLGDDRDDPGDA